MAVWRNKIAEWIPWLILTIICAVSGFQVYQQQHVIEDQDYDIQRQEVVIKVQSELLQNQRQLIEDHKGARDGQ